MVDSGWSEQDAEAETQRSFQIAAKFPGDISDYDSYNSLYDVWQSLY
jgi:hypothetical protein